MKDEGRMKEGSRFCFTVWYGLRLCTAWYGLSFVYLLVKLCVSRLL